MCNSLKFDKYRPTAYDKHKQDLQWFLQHSIRVDFHGQNVHLGSLQLPQILLDDWAPLACFLWALQPMSQWVTTLQLPLRFTWVGRKHPSSIIPQTACDRGFICCISYIFRVWRKKKPLWCYFILFREQSSHTNDFIIHLIKATVGNGLLWHASIRYVLRISSFLF